VGAIVSDLWRGRPKPGTELGMRYAQIMCNPYTGLRTLKFWALGRGNGWALCLNAAHDDGLPRPNCRWVGNANPVGIGGPP
jgi:hypothetical protein